MDGRACVCIDDSESPLGPFHHEEQAPGLIPCITPVDTTQRSEAIIRFSSEEDPTMYGSPVDDRKLTLDNNIRSRKGCVRACARPLYVRAYTT